MPKNQLDAKYDSKKTTDVLKKAEALGLSNEDLVRKNGLWHSFTVMRTLA